MESLLFFARNLSVELRKVYETFYFGHVNYKVLSFSSDYATYDEYRTYGGTKLRMKDNQYVILEELYEDMDLDALQLEVHVEEHSKIKLEDYTDDYGTEEDGILVGILFPTDYLYELLYDFGMLGEKFYDEEKDNAVKALLSTVYEVANAFDFELHFVGGRILITRDNESLDDGFVCKNMEEVEARNKLREGESEI
jgi:hypothetical protein